MTAHVMPHHCERARHHVALKRGAWAKAASLSRATWMAWHSTCLCRGRGGECGPQHIQHLGRRVDAQHILGHVHQKNKQDSRDASCAHELLWQTELPARALATSTVFRLNQEARAYTILVVCCVGRGGRRACWSTR